jgi:hypothetical protein
MARHAGFPRPLRYAKRDFRERGNAVPIRYLDYYGSLFHEAFNQTLGVAKLEELPLTLSLGILGALFYVVWKRGIDGVPVNDWKALLFASVAPIAVVFGIRFLWNATMVPVERVNEYRQEISNLKSKLDDSRKQLADFHKQVNARIVAMERDGYPDQLPKGIRDAQAQRERALAADHKNVALMDETEVQGASWQAKSQLEALRNGP